jgi:hypothetical protein
MGAQSLLVGSEYLNKEIFSGRKKGRGGGPYQKKGTLARAGLTEQAARTKHAATTASISQTLVIWLPLPHCPRNGDRRHLVREMRAAASKSDKTNDFKIGWWIGVV